MFVLYFRTALPLAIGSVEMVHARGQVIPPPVHTVSEHDTQSIFKHVDITDADELAPLLIRSALRQEIKMETAEGTSNVTSATSTSTADSMEQSAAREPETIAESLSVMFNNNELSDVCFKFPNETVEEKCVLKAHKLILAIRSPVFKAMFYGTLQETGQDVNIEDISYEIFQSLLRYFKNY